VLYSLYLKLQEKALNKYRRQVSAGFPGMILIYDNSQHGVTGADALFVG